jgi:hypothetical protein
LAILEKRQRVPYLKKQTRELGGRWLILKFAIVDPVDLFPAPRNTQLPTKTWAANAQVGAVVSFDQP